LDPEEPNFGRPNSLNRLGQLRESHQTLAVLKADLDLQTCFQALCVGRMIKMRKHWEHSMCPHCLQDNKTTEHVLLCQDPQVAEYFKSLAKKLDIELVTMETAPEIRRTIIRKLTNWRRRRRITAQITNKYGG
jgi:hypothetical protein